MLAKALRSLAIVLCFALAAPAVAQTGHPVKGSWLGYWGPSDSDQRRLFLNLDWQGREIVGVINPGPKAAKIAHATIDYDTWTMTLEADMPTSSGELAHWVATGTLSNLGSWSSRRFSGTYTHGAEKGTFQVTIN